MTRVSRLGLHRRLAARRPPWSRRPRGEASGLGGPLAERIDFVPGDFGRRATESVVADIVTLDRVVCCCPDADALVGSSAARARRVYGLVLPRDRGLVPGAIRVLNLGA